MNLVSKEGKAGDWVREEGRSQLREGHVGCVGEFGFLPSMIARADQCRIVFWCGLYRV